MLLFYLFLYLCTAYEVAGHAYYMTSTACTRTIAVGTSIMFKSAISDDTRQITVKRGNVLLADGSTYIPGEKLTVSLSDTGGEYVFELDQGSFENGFCTDSRRYANSAGTLIAPSGGTGSLTIIAAWAPSKTNVRVLTPFTLVEEVALTTAVPTAIPTLLLSAAPSLIPTTQPSVAPTTSPSSAPTPIRSAIPTDIPTTKPSVAPTSRPSSTPTPIPSAMPTANPTTKPSVAPTTSPSSALTPIPSAIPTDIPTTKPSVAPTNHPSSAPTPIPSAIPTANPTIRPSVASTTSLSSALTPIPSAVPTDIPTTKPSVVPTTSPSSAPTPRPSAIPTTQFSPAPTLSSSATQPSPAPTPSPSAIPTTPGPSAIPTTKPSAIPTNQPSPAPTPSPSAIPADIPTTQPSTVPTPSPSSASTPSPSAIPTFQSNVVPSTRPSVAILLSPRPTPSASFSDVPSEMPTSLLSAHLSVVPTLATSEPPTGSDFPAAVISSAVPTKRTETPTDNPTLTPLAHTSSAPTAGGPATFIPSVSLTAFHPTHSPSSAPTGTPSVTPSLDSTVAPSASPTHAPTVLPTTIPSTTPVVAPTTAPTVIHTADPSTKPTAIPTPTSPLSGAPSGRPTITPTPAPTSPPSYTPTRTPTVTITPQPTTEVLTVVSFRADQALSNVSASNIAVDHNARDTLAATMKLALSQSMHAASAPNLVNVATVTSLSLPVHDAQLHLRYVSGTKALLSGEPSTRVSYLIAFYLEETTYETPEDLLEGLDIALNVVMDSQLFLATLRSFNVSALNNARTASMLSTALEDVEVLRSTAPTVAPTTATTSSSSSESRAYHTPVNRKVTVGLVVGVLSLAGLSLTVYLYATAEQVFLIQFHRVVACLPLLFALFASAVAIGLVSLWATDSPSGDPFYLNKPHWQRNIFAYHPMFMVLFCALQVQAMVGWSIFSAYLTSRRAHVLVQVCAALSAVAALVAVVTDMWDTRSPSLVSMHSWVGVAAVAVFGFNFLWGSAMGFLSAFHKHSPLHVRLSLLLSHKFLGVTALVLAAMAVQTGVMDFLPRGACDYQLGSNTALQKDFDPAENYSYIPGSCKLGNGLGMAVLAATVCAVLTVLVRNVRGEGYAALLKHTSTVVAPAPARPSPTLKKKISEVEWENFGRDELLRQHCRRAAQQLEGAAGSSTKQLRRGELVQRQGTPSTVSTH